MEPRDDPGPRGRHVVASRPSVAAQDLVQFPQRAVEAAVGEEGGRSQDGPGSQKVRVQAKTDLFLGHSGFT
jgi:hypothetical protein